MIGKARLQDAEEIQQILAPFAEGGELLPLTLNDIYTKVRSFYIFRELATGPILGVCSLQITWADLGEIRSLAVRPESQGRGVGSKLVEACLAEGRELGLARIFTLTYRPEFFERLGFALIDKVELPHKVWNDCIRCQHYFDCNETALIKDLSGAAQTCAEKPQSGPFRIVG
ncbi:MAG: N-acetyltransferase [Candidatus Methylomirabilis sp.]|nr:N-acetyltransferase [Deltaproteobacteria bacterium]